jgi:hypothetical protein
MVWHLLRCMFPILRFAVNIAKLPVLILSEHQFSRPRSRYAPPRGRMRENTLTSSSLLSVRTARMSD